MCEKGKKMILLLKAMRGKKSVLLGGNLWTINGKDSKYPLESSCQMWTIICKKLYDITNFMNYETPSLGKRLTLAELRPYQEECLHPSLPQGKYVRAL